MPEIIRPLNAGENEILTAIGYLTMRWNYAEHCARQIVRRYSIPSGDIDDADHIKLSAKPAIWVETELRDNVLPNWQDPGRRYLSALIDAYASARAHRNHKVHGIMFTGPGGGNQPAQGVLINMMPVGGKTQAPDFVVATDLVALFEPFRELGDFAQKVGVAFSKDGSRATNAAGDFVLDPLPALIVPLPAPVRKALSGGSP